MLSGEMVRQARILAQATSDLVNAIKADAEGESDLENSRKLLSAAKILADATAKMVEAAKVGSLLCRLPDWALRRVQIITHLWEQPGKSGKIQENKYRSTEEVDAPLGSERMAPDSASVTRRVLTDRRPCPSASSKSRVHGSSCSLLCGYCLPAP